MKTKAILIMLLLVIVIGCKNETKTEEISEIESLELKLNNGAKWLANPETQGGVEKMQSIIKAFKKEPTKDYPALGQKLSKQTSYIIKNCTMQGEPHDQLHVVLVPMLEKITNLKEADTNAKGEQALIKLEGLIKDYFNHFEL